MKIVSFKFDIHCPRCPERFVYRADAQYPLFQEEFANEFEQHLRDHNE